MDPLVVLPSHILAIVIALLPLGTRLRCREVSRGWRDYLNDQAHWEVLDMSCEAHGFTYSLQFRDRNGPLFHFLANRHATRAAALARAGASLRSLTVPCEGQVLDDLDELVPVCAGAVSLRHLCFNMHMF